MFRIPATKSFSLQESGVVATKADAPSPPTSLSLTQSAIDIFVDDHLGVSAFAQANRCRDLVCMGRKVIYHRCFRNWNQWQSLLLHRYFWNLLSVLVPKEQARSLLSIHHVHLKRSPGGKWVRSRGTMSAENWRPCASAVDNTTALFDLQPIGGSSPDPVTVFLAEMWEEENGTGRRGTCVRDAQGRHSAAWFHNLVLIQPGCFSKVEGGGGGGPPTCLAKQKHTPHATGLQMGGHTI